MTATTYLVFQPEKEPVQKGGLPRWRKSCEVVTFPEGERKAGSNASKMQTIKTGNIVLFPGVNSISTDRLKKALEHQPVSDRIQALTACGALEAVPCELEEPLGCSSDFEDIINALKVVNASFNLAFLELSLKRENRAKVLKAVQDRLDMLNEERRARNSEM